MNTVTFPNLGLSFQVNKIAFSIGAIQVHWYALIILTGVILGFLYASIFAKREKLDVDCLYDVLLWGLPTALIFARLYYVIFNFSVFQNNLGSVFHIWEGGLAIYGGIIGAAISTYIYARVKKIPVLQLFDMGAFGLIVGQSVGRWGNFVNEEAYGSVTNSLFAMTSDQIQREMSLFGANVAVHPTFLYESVWNLVGAVLLGLFHKHKKHHGQVFFLYLTWYGIGRFFVEGLRMDSLYWGSLRISQVVGLVTAVIGVAMLVYFFRKPATFSLQTVCKDAEKLTEETNHNESNQ